MSISKDQVAQLAAEGISVAHTQSFLAVAAQEDCVVLTRTPGMACLQLLAEAYDAKGFHIKGKSCSWGPMAGFLCAEPLFNKGGVDGAATNASAHLASLTVAFGNEGKDTTPLYSSLVPLEISDARRQWVETHVGPTTLQGQVRSGVTRRADMELRWALVPVAGTTRWRVYYDPNSIAGATTAVKDRLAAKIAAAKDEAERKAAQGVADKLRAYEVELARQLAAQPAAITSPPGLAGYRPVLALTNPHRPYTAADEAYRNAVTGDFDLFAVWPRRDRAAEFRVRVGGMLPGVEVAQQKQQIYGAEAKDAIGRVAGNISNGLYMIGQLLNSSMADPSSVVQVNRVFHSDEGGRPGMDTVDSSVAFTPAGEVHMFGDGSPDFVRFILACAEEGFVVFLNAGWIAPLGETARAAGLDAQWQAFVPKIEGQTALRAG